MKLVFLAEDDGALRNLFTSALEDEYEIKVFRTGKSLVSELQRGERLPDLLLLDIDMPEVSGIEVLEEMNKETKLLKIPVIMLSNVEKPETIAKARDLGAREFVKKSEVEIKDLKSVCKRYV